jgi:hypothetical protein
MVRAASSLRSRDDAAMKDEAYMKQEGEDGRDAARPKNERRSFMRYR